MAFVHEDHPLGIIPLQPCPIFPNHDGRCTDWLTALNDARAVIRSNTPLLQLFQSLSFDTQFTSIAVLGLSHPLDPAQNPTAVYELALVLELAVVMVEGKIRWGTPGEVEIPSTGTGSSGSGKSVSHLLPQLLFVDSPQWQPLETQFLLALPKAQVLPDDGSTTPALGPDTLLFCSQKAELAGQTRVWRFLFETTHCLAKQNPDPPVPMLVPNLMVLQMDDDQARCQQLQTLYESPLFTKTVQLPASMPQLNGASGHDAFANMVFYRPVGTGKKGGKGKKGKEGPKGKAGNTAPKG